jgi:hypothetical protein
MRYALILGLILFAQITSIAAKEDSAIRLLEMESRGILSNEEREAQAKKMKLRPTHQEKLIQNVNRSIASSYSDTKMVKISRAPLEINITPNK